MPDERAETTGSCYACKRVFSYDPKDVVTFLVDPETGFPPGLTPLGSLRPATPEAVARSVDLPVCPDCVDKARRFGTNPWDGPGTSGPPSPN
ncbi:hypothetical protein [Nonomuraea aridisoli]|uniref:Uncharacterized protein n=1 Tax=Nonomuraea aridisoli TaxID=2070368 RepID=A0A2W2E009_9ACTN|nr:hypothetical protein [Nonomuraea aridisoli]PZG06780.1 hypothetical protein C1J01_41950 [Nonomuraea aridisoli]